jgi:hypothetical protein
MDFLDPGQQPDVIPVSPAQEAAEKARLEGEVAELRQQLAAVPVGEPEQRHQLALELARNLAALERGEEAWPLAREALDHFLEREQWQQAAEACEVLYLADQPQSLAALGQGIWLAVTYPIDPEVTLTLLQHLVDDTPPEADGAAVAAATAAFVADLRATGEKREDLLFFTQQMLGNVARRHSQVESQQQFDYWIEKLELDQPDKFLVRLRNIVDVLVQDDWWFDREELQSRLPES